MCTWTFISNKMTGKWKYLYILQMQSILINNLTNVYVWIPSTIRLCNGLWKVQIHNWNAMFDIKQAEPFQECKFYCMAEHCCCQKKFGTSEFIGVSLEYFLFLLLTWNTQRCCSDKRQANVLSFCYHDKPKIHLQNPTS